MNTRQKICSTMLIRRAHVAIFVIVIVIVGVATVAVADEPSADGNTKRITVTVDRGQDVGQSCGSLFEMTSSDGSVVIGAGFQNLYNTRYRADRHSLQFFVRPTSDERSHITETLPRPNELCGTYLYSRDDVVRSTYGGVTAWNQQAELWDPESSVGGTDETMEPGHLRGISRRSNGGDGPYQLKAATIKRPLLSH